MMNIKNLKASTIMAWPKKMKLIVGENFVSYKDGLINLKTKNTSVGLSIVEEHIAKITAALNEFKSIEDKGTTSETINETESKEDFPLSEEKKKVSKKRIIKDLTKPDGRRGSKKNKKTWNDDELEFLYNNRKMKRQPLVDAFLREFGNKRSRKSVELMLSIISNGQLKKRSKKAFIKYNQIINRENGIA